MSDKPSDKPHPNEPYRFPKSRSGNPGGKPSIAKDCEHASLLLTPEERTRLGLKDGEALSAAWLRANWLRRIALVAMTEPRVGNDTNWRYAASELGNRLYGKPKEIVEMTIEGGAGASRLDLDALPLDERRKLLAAAERMNALAAGAADDKPTEH
jgi:hypothetical protein